MADTVRLRNVGPVDLHLGGLDGQIVKADCLTEVRGRVVTDLAEIAAALGLPEGVAPNVADDVVHIVEASGQLRAWPTATWRVEGEQKTKAKG